MQALSTAVSGLTGLAGSFGGVVTTNIVDPDSRKIDPEIRRCVWALLWVGGWVRNDPPTPYEKTHRTKERPGLGSASKKMRVFRGARGDRLAHWEWV